MEGAFRKRFDRDNESCRPISRLEVGLEASSPVECPIKTPRISLPLTIILRNALAKRR